MAAPVSLAVVRVMRNAVKVGLELILENYG